MGRSLQPESRYLPGRVPAGAGESATTSHQMGHCPPADVVRRKLPRGTGSGGETGSGRETGSGQARLPLEGRNAFSSDPLLAAEEVKSQH